MNKFLPKNSKRGITLVESVVAVVVLGILVTGILTLLTTGGIKIQEISGESATYAKACQKMDLVISAISNGSDSYIHDNALDVNALISGLSLGDVTIAQTADLYDASASATDDNIRGWYLKLTYQDVTVQGFASNSKGVFDQ